MLEDKDKWVQAGRVSAQILEFGVSLIKKGVPLIEVCDAVDKKTAELGAKPGFPAQISLDHVAAHYCCSSDDKTVLESQIAKLDVGAHVDGFSGDNAATVDLSGSNSELVKASKQALDAAIKIVKPGTTLSQIGEVIQSEITSLGFSPIRNLCGHGIAKFNLHTKPTVPNFDNNDPTKLKPWQVIAIEPFATTGEGVIVEATAAEVFMEVARKPVRDATARQIMKEIETYEKCLLQKRWLTKKIFQPSK